VNIFINLFFKFSFLSSIFLKYFFKLSIDSPNLLDKSSKYFILFIKEFFFSSFISSITQLLQDECCPFPFSFITHKQDAQHIINQEKWTSRKYT